MSSNMPPSYSEDGDAPSHGDETAIYQELVKIRVQYEKWVCDNKISFPNDEFESLSTGIEAAFVKMEEELNQPF